MAKLSKKSRYKRAATAVQEKYGISVLDFESLWDRSSGQCEICGETLRSTLNGDHVERSEKRGVACIDHCHDTGQVRGLLCSTCNIAIGMLGDSADSLRRAVDYLSRDYLQPKTTNAIGCAEFHAGLDTAAASGFGKKLKKQEREAWAQKRGPVIFKYLWEKPLAA